MKEGAPVQPPIRLADPTPGERHAGLALLAESESTERRQLLLSQLQAALAGERDEPLEGVAVQGELVVGYFCSTRLGSDVAVLLGPAVAPSLAAAPAAVEQLFHAYHRRLADAGITFVQALRALDDPARWLRLGGYRAIAALDYLVAPVPDDFALGTTAPRGAPKLRFDTVDPGDDFCQPFWAAIEETYQGTLDCPEIAGFRTTRQVVQCYRESPSFAPDCWLLARDGEGTVGVVITTPHRGTSTLELTYMGVAPRGRGQGYGNQLVAQAFATARRLGMRDVVLAVDRRNEPAQAIYGRFGFSHLLSERVWVRSLDEG